MSVVFYKKIALLLCIAIAVPAFIFMPINAAFFFSFFGIGFTIYAVYIIHLLIQCGVPFERDLFLRRIVSMLLGSLFCGVVLECLTIIGDPATSVLSLRSWSFIRALVFACVAFCFISGACAYKISKGFPEHIENPNSPSMLVKVRCYFSTSVFAAVILSCLVILFNLVVSYAIRIFFDGQSARMAFLLLISFEVVIAFITYKGGLLRFYNCVLLCIILIGSFISFALPPITGWSWDDQIHYDHALGLSYLGRSSYDSSDEILVHVPWSVPSIPELGTEQMKDAELSVASSYGSTAADYKISNGFVSPVDQSSLAVMSTVGYIPSAIGLWTARLLHLARPLQFILGRFFNLISYAVLCAWAIRVCPRKKTLVAAISLLPTSVYIAAQYSYDAMVTSWLLFAVCFLLKELYQPEKRLGVGAGFILFLSFTFGLAPKAIYFPLLGLMLLMPDGKFKDHRSCRNFKILVTAFALVMILSFTLPMLFSTSAQAGDARGGSDVSAIGQIIFILQHPIQFLGVLWRFIIQYISPVVSDQYSILLAYLGMVTSRFAWLATCPLIILVACVASGDTPNKRMFSRGKALFVLFLVLVTVALVATALYVSFTPVGHWTVNGCQPRYLIPLIFPALYFSRILLAGDFKVESLKPGVASAFLMSFICLISLESLAVF